MNTKQNPTCLVRLSISVLTALLTSQNLFAANTTQINAQVAKQKLANVVISTLPQSTSSQIDTDKVLKDPKLKIDFKNLKKFDFAKETGGIDGSGGGSVLYCSDGKGVFHYELYDYEEGSRPKRGLKIDLGPKELSVEEKIEIALSRLAEKNPTRAARYADMANAFFDNAEKVEKSKFGKTPDVKNEIIPENCERIQAIIQIDPLLPEDKRFNINDKVWAQLDNDTKAGLILHEIIYFEQGLVDVRMVRYFNSWIASSNFTSLTSKQYVDIVKLAKLKGFDAIPGIVCFSETGAFDDQGNLLHASSCLSARGSELNLPGLKATTKSNYTGTSMQYNYMFSFDSWMLQDDVKNLTVESIGLVENGRPKNYSAPGVLMLKDDKIKIGRDIEILGLDLPRLTLSLDHEEFQKTVKYAGVEYDTKNLVFAPYLFKLWSDVTWVLKTNSSETNLRSLKCSQNEYPIGGYMITKITEKRVQVAVLCNSLTERNAQVRTMEVPR